MDMIPVENSSNILAFGWENNILRIQFIKNRSYDYLNVSYEIYQGFINAESKGKYFWKYINKKYDCKPI